MLFKCQLKLWELSHNKTVLSFQASILLLGLPCTCVTLLPVPGNFLLPAFRTCICLSCSVPRSKGEELCGHFCDVLSFSQFVDPFSLFAVSFNLCFFIFFFSSSSSLLLVRLSSSTSSLFTITVKHPIQSRIGPRNWTTSNYFLHSLMDTN